MVRRSPLTEQWLLGMQRSTLQLSLMARLPLTEQKLQAGSHSQVT